MNTIVKILVKIINYNFIRNILIKFKINNKFLKIIVINYNYIILTLIKRHIIKRKIIIEYNKLYYNQNINIK